MRFLGLTLGNNIPDTKMIWLFRDTLTKANVMTDLFALFNQTLEVAHLITHTGSIVDATFVDAPRQRNTREEHQTIKRGRVPEEWAAHKLFQKDTDARWTKKNNEIHFGYKNHAKVYVHSKLIATYSVHDSQELLGLWEDAQKESNRLKFKVCVRVEHVFGFMTGSLHGLTLRCI